MSNLKLKIVTTKTNSKLELESEVESNTKDELENVDDTNDLFEGDTIILGTSPKTESWKYIPLFKEGLNGEIAVWQIGFDHPNSRLKTVYGKIVTSKGEQGKLVTAYHPIVTNNSGRSLQEQALLEARKKYLDQYTSKGYLPKGEELPAELKNKAPMLAHKLKLEILDSDDGIVIQKFPVNVSEKIDGIRNLSRMNTDGSVYMRSRNNKPHEAPLTHIKNEIGVFLKYLPYGSEVDGELYSHEIKFNEISGVIRTKKGIHPKHNLIKYFIFDIIEPKRLPYEKRYALLVNSYVKYLEDGNKSNTFSIVQTYSAYSEQEILDYHDKFVKNGYEGLMVRRYACAEVGNCCKKYYESEQIEKLCKKCEKGYNLSLYKPNKNNNLLKYKKFSDKEVEIIGCLEGVGTEQGAIIYQVKDESGNVFTVRPVGTIEERRELYKNRNKLVGKPLTIRYQELSKDGVPRFPTSENLYEKCIGWAVRDYE